MERSRLRKLAELHPARALIVRMWYYVLLFFLYCPMKRFVLLLAVLFPAIAFARTYDDAHLPYNDAPRDLPTAIAVSVLTDEGILQGNPDGMFLGGRLLNRAEFVTIAMRLFSLWPNTEMVADVDLSCFPDVEAGEWYAPSVCLAKAMGIVRGNAVTSLPPDQWLFVPERPVQYEEALTVLANIFEVPVDLSVCTGCGVQWYQPYFDAAREHGIDLIDMQPGHQLTRGQMARLVVGFLAYSDGELELLRDAERGYTGLCAPIVCSDGRIFPACDGQQLLEYETDPCAASLPDDDEGEEEDGAQPDADPVQYDPDPNMSTKADFLLLGSTSPVLGAANVFNDIEPFDVTEVKITLVDEAFSIDSFSVYDHDARSLGRAYRTAPAEYVLLLTNGMVTIPKREHYSMYVRANLKGYRSGGASGEDVQISNITVRGDGIWSRRSYSKYTSETYSAFQTSRSTITVIENGGDQNGLLLSGTDLPIGSFRFEGVTGDSSADLAVTDLAIAIEKNDDISVANVTLRTEASSDSMECTVASSTITCSSIPAEFGDFSRTSRILTLYGDVTVPAELQNARVRLQLNQAGNVSSAGSVTWTDGDTSFTWVPFSSPVAAGTYYSR